MNFLNSQKKYKNDLSFDSLPDGIFILEQDGKIVDVNTKAQSILKKNKNSIIGNYFSNFIENGTAILNEIIAEEKIICAKTVPEDKDEYPQILEISASRNVTDAKVYVCCRNSTNEHKEQREIYEKYLFAQKIIDGKNDFLLDSAGAILSNLVSISGFSKAILDGIGGALSDKQKKYLNIINTNARDLNYDLEKLFSLFRVESNKIKYSNKPFDMVNLIKSIDRIYKKDFEDKKIIFSLNYSLSQRDCYLDVEIIEQILRSIMDIFYRFSKLGKCSLNIGHPPLDFLKTREFSANNSYDSEKYILFEAKIADLVFEQEELDNIFDAYSVANKKRPIGLRATLNFLKRYITDFKGDIWVYSKQNFGTMFTFVLPLK